MSTTPPPGQRARGTEIRPRLVITQCVYHQLQGQEPTLAASNYARWLWASEQAYQRRGTATSEWARLDPGWLRGQAVSQLVLESLEASAGAMRPTPAEQERQARRVIRVGIFLGESSIRGLASSDQGAPASPGATQPRPPLVTGQSVGQEDDPLRASTSIEQIKELDEEAAASLRASIGAGMEEAAANPSKIFTARTGRVLSSRNHPDGYIQIASLRPGESMRLEPTDVTLLAVCCLEENARYLLTLIPG